MKNLYLAKSKPQKTIQEHTDEVMKCLQSLKEIYPNEFGDIWDAIETAILCHDLGKINSRFQNDIYRVLKLIQRLADDLKAEYQKENVNQQIPHGILSAMFIDYDALVARYDDLTAKAVLLAVCFHHNRDNLFEIMDKKIGLVKRVITEDVAKQVVGFPVQGKFLLSKPGIQYYHKIPYKIAYHNLTEIDQNKFWPVFARIKGILNRADYAASGGLDKIEIDPFHEGKTIAQIVREKLPRLREVQEYMTEHQGKNLLVVAATGIGKTEAALLWNGGRKMFYTLPLRVSINAIYERIKGKEKDGEKQGYWYAKAELLHSDALAYYLNEAKEQEATDIEPFIRYQQARIFAAPLTVCTVDQLFKFVFKCNGYEAMFATLAYSNVVIDELQMYSPSIIACILYGLKLISDAGGRFAIITATFPKVLLDFFHELEIPVKIPEKPFLREDLGPRHRIALCYGEFEVDRILATAKTKKVLIIVNTVKKAQELYQELFKSSSILPVKLLHSNFIIRDRRRLEEEIITFAPGDYSKRTDDQLGIWICTQVVEASLDLDFDILFTEMSIVDSILQRTGRCFRQREYHGADPNVIIYVTKIRNGIGKRSVYDPDLYDFSLKRLEKLLRDHEGQMFTEELKQEYIDQVYDPDQNPDIREKSYYKDIQERLSTLKNLRPLALEQSKVDEEFRDINSVSLIPEAIYNQLDNEGKIDAWKKLLNQTGLGKKERASLMTEIQDYIVNVRWRRELEYDHQGDFLGNQKERHLGIYRTRLKYEFNSEGKGRGLIIDQEEIDNFQ
jgi:CRISPR-associated endonuclease/helicase Cas3